MLRDVASALTATLRTADVIARLGGDEFGVILTGAEAAAADRINHTLKEMARRANRGYPITVSMGVASGSPGSAFSLHGLIRAADEAMYANRRRRHLD